MILFGILLGFFTELIYFLGIFHLYYTTVIITITAIYWIIGFYFLFNKNTYHFYHFKNLGKYFSKVDFVICLILFALFLVNLIGSLSPEFAFDALWYHLTLPKLYILHHEIWHIPGGLLYYSDMPKLGELLYVVALSIGNENTAKLIQLFAGVFVSGAIFQISKKYLNKTYSLLAVLVFYSNLVVAWESTTAYIDLIRTIFEITALWSFIYYIEKRNLKDLIATSLLVGFSIMSKLIALGTLIIFVLLLSIFLIEGKDRHKALKIIFFILISLLVPLPWFIFSYIHTGNPIYPFFTSVYPTSININLLNPVNFIVALVKELTMADDPISPIYLITIPILVLYWKKIPKRAKVLIYYSVLAVLIWYFTPRTGGGRFLLPYLPVFSILVSNSLQILSSKYRSDNIIKTFLLIVIFALSFTTIVYRGVASIRYVPVVFGLETKQNFLMKNLNFSFGDFYDTDGYFATHIKSNDKVLLIGFHNLYYVDFPFIDSTWLKNHDKFDYIATQNARLPQKYQSWHLVYTNQFTKVNLYRKGIN